LLEKFNEEQWKNEETHQKLKEEGDDNQSQYNQSPKDQTKAKNRRLNTSGILNSYHLIRRVF
tara:strand:+ start:158 stop:343 length:186 start_codon:yes stop_codon:yes gene_type:complete